MRDLNYQLKQLCQQCREGAYNTQANRECQDIMQSIL